jgi:hypothetical protein
VYVVNVCKVERVDGKMEDDDVHIETLGPFASEVEAEAKAHELQVEIDGCSEYLNRDVSVEYNMFACVTEMTHASGLVTRLQDKYNAWKLKRVAVFSSSSSSAAAT